jgi:soluble lytic murein transglycosylase
VNAALERCGLSGIWGRADLTRQRRSALVAALAGASLLAIAQCVVAAQTTATQDESKGPPAATANAAAKHANPSGKKAAAGKSASKSTHKSRKTEATDKSTEKRSPRPETSDPDVALVGSAIDSLRSGGAEKATQVEATISDPVARKLVEWIILRNDSNRTDSTRYAAFIAANPSWPCLAALRRHAEARLWVEDAKPTQVLRFFNGSPPLTAKGRLALARALLAQGDSEGAGAQVREAWRNDPMSADLEKQVLERYSQLLSRADHKARMEKSLFAADNEAAMRAARRLGGADVAIAHARIALNRKGGNVRKLLEAVPAEAHQDAGYLFARAHLLRHDGKIAPAAQVMLSAPRELAQIHDPEEWWVERRVLSRKLLDIGDARSAYLVVRDAAEPTKENSRVERHFMAGWLALRFLGDPATAATHFARIPEVSKHPTSLARSHYWLARAAEALHDVDQAQAEYQAAARASASYYGQLARARLGLSALALAAPPAADERPGAQGRELVRAVEILYALDERSLVIPLMADLGEKLDDLGVLFAIGDLAEQRQDARGMLALGKTAMARGLPLDHFAFPTVSVPRYSPIGPGIDTAVLFAIIRQESSFNPDDWSAAHAMGLMQVTPIAARDTCKRFGCKFDVKRLKHDTPYNLQLGAAELGGVIEEYRGNYTLAFAAYNAGRGRVSEWIGLFGDPRDPKVDPIDWVERIPIMETRNYVQRVMENMQVYRARFGNKVPFTIESDVRGTAATH